MKSHVIIPGELYRAIVTFLNSLVNTKISVKNYRDSYALAGALDQCVQKEQSVTVIFGYAAPTFEDIVSYRCDGTPAPAENASAAVRDLVIATRTYQTLEELNAYLEGINDANGWLELRVLEEPEARDIQIVLEQLRVSL